MNEEVFYDIKSVPLADRESFNNTILLLTMVKSKYYYMIGFSRPEAKIVVGFDFEFKIEGIYTKELIVDFGCSNSEIVLSCQIMKTTGIDVKIISEMIDSNENIFLENDMLIYKHTIAKDTIYPSSIRTMNYYFMSARQKIEKVLKNCC